MLAPPSTDHIGTIALFPPLVQGIAIIDMQLARLDVRPLMAAHAPTVEHFLARFHDSRPGLTPKAYAALPVAFRGRVYASSYEVLASVVPNTGQPAEVLDLACGDGFLLSLLAARDQPQLGLCGVDISSGELAAATQRLGASASLIRARAQELPYLAGRFDFVLCHMALMLMDDTERVLREVRRILTGEGTFAAVIGTNPPTSPALSLYIKALSRHSRDAQWSTVRFADARLRTRDGMVELMSQAFGNVVVEELHLPLRLSPQELWLWLSDMYDLHLLRDQDRQAVEHELLEAVVSECASDGKIEFSQSMRYVSATAT